jgi:hypothetical protein
MLGGLAITPSGFSQRAAIRTIHVEAPGGGFAMQLAIHQAPRCLARTRRGTGCQSPAGLADDIQDVEQVAGAAGQPIEARHH